MKSLVALLLAFLMTLPVAAAAINFSSGDARTTLLELYTSEGCSSCPPADRWLSQLKDDPRLWRTLFPVAFHVDYWDYLGWRDAFAKAEYSARQRNYADHDYAATVYTPGFFHNGREWRRWFRSHELRLDQPIKVGVLTVTLADQAIDAQFTAPQNYAELGLHVALLAFDQTTQIRAGENRGKVLRHDFVAIEYESYSSRSDHWHITDGRVFDQLNKAAAIVVWVTQGDDPTPIQTTGGWLPPL